MAGQNAFVSRAVIEYFDAIVANGAFVVDSTGKGDLNPALAAVVDAFHEILAGGKVQITVATPGTPAIKKDLEDKKQAALASLNVPAAPGGPIIFTP